MLPLAVLQGSPPSAVPSPSVVWEAGVPAAGLGSTKGQQQVRLQLLRAALAGMCVV